MCAQPGRARVDAAALSLFVHSVAAASAAHSGTPRVPVVAGEG